jgi:hypothetical protein
MSTESSSRPPAASDPTARKRPQRRQETAMLILGIGFFLGIALFILLPEGAPRGIGLSLYSAAIFWSLFRFGL